MIFSNAPQVKTKIVALWATPRSVSTAFEKTFSQRADSTVIHEPFCDVYYFSDWRISDRFGDCEHLRSYSTLQAIEKISSQGGNLTFFKDHAYQAMPYIDSQFLSKIVNTIIIRDPREVMASWYRAEEYPTEEEFGFTVLKRLWQIVTEELQQRSIVVEANRFRHNPADVLQRYCQNIEIEYDPNMLTWQQGQLQTWDKREAEFHAKWHSTLNGSQGIMPPTSSTLEIRPQEREMVDRAMDIYQEISAFAL